MKNLKVALAAACAVVVGYGFTASAAYVPVEWIKANGKQWIYTGYVPKCTDKVEIKIKTDTVGTTHGLWCSRGATTSTATFTGFLSSTKKFLFHRNANKNNNYSDDTVVANTDYVVTADGNTLVCTVNGKDVSAKMESGTFTPSNAFSLFATYASDSFNPANPPAMDNFGTYTLYSFRVYDKDGNLVRQYIPARDDSVSSGTAQHGLYESLTKTFYPGLGSGSFTAGPEGSIRINPGTQEVEYAVHVECNEARGTVSVDGVDVGARYEQWFAMGVDVTFQATPKPGYVFARWDGADDVLTGARRISPRMTVTVDRPLALTAVYSVALSARAYVQDGLIAQWDAIENAGYGQHDGAATVWKDLSRSGYDIALPTSGVVVSDKIIQLLQTKMTAVVPELATRGLFHGEAYAAADEDFVSSNTRKEVFYNHQIALFFRNVSSGVICGAFFLPNGQTGHWYAPGKATAEFIQSMRTYSLSSCENGSTYSCDGSAQTERSDAKFDWPWPANIYGTTGDLHLGSTECTLNYGGLRLYKRKLTDAEVAWNAMIDRARFAGEALDPEVTLENIRVVDGVVQYGCKAAADDTGFGTVEIAVDGEAGTTGECNWFEAGKKAKVVFKAKPASGKAFVRWEGETTLGNDKLMSPTLEVEDMPLALTAVFREGTTKTWVGTSESANVAENWSPVGVPESGDAIVLNGDCNQPMTWDIKDVKPGSWVQDGYTGTVTIPVGTPGIKFYVYSCPVYGCEYDGNITRFEVIGDVVIKSGAWKSAAHPSNNAPNPATACSEGLGAYRLYVKVGGIFHLEEGASVDADSCGFCYYLGPGGTSSGSVYGGAGQNGTTVPLTYGSVYRPVHIGGGGGGTTAFSGGAVRIEADGAVTINGRISADATDFNSTAYCGAGGSVLIVGSSISGTGEVRADGGESTYTVGGGGRVALVQTGEATDFSAWRGTARAFGGFKSYTEGSGQGYGGSPGTVYYETADRKFAGDLVIQGYGRRYWTWDTNKRYSASRPNADTMRWNATILSGNVGGVTNLTFDTVTVKDCANLGIGTNVTVRVNHLDCTGVGTNSVTLFGGTLVLPDATELTGMSLRVFRKDSSITFADDAAEKTLTIGSGTEFVVDGPCRIDGNLVIADGGVVRQTCVDTVSNSNHIELEISGDMTIASEGEVTADGFGWYDKTAPGYAQEGDYRGGSHGGLASLASGSVCYGSVTRPVLAGSPGRGGASGGGVIRLQVAGQTRIDGLVTASGKPRIYPDSSNKSEYYPQGAGGSIWLTTGSLVGSGRIRADGGYCRACANSGSGGGRISVWLTEAGADFSDFTVTNITAYGAHTKATTTNQRAGAGTVYLKTGSQAEDEGTLIIANADGTATDEGVTRISDRVTDTAVGRVVIEQGARLAIAAGSSLTVKDDWTNREPADHFTADLSTDAAIPHAEVKFVDATKESKITGSNCFANLTCVTPGKTLRFGADAAADLMRVNGVLKLAGEEGNPLSVKSETDGEPWLLDVVGSADVSYVTAWDSDARPGKPVVNIAGKIQRTQNWSVIIPIVPGAVNTWTGADTEHPTDWTSAANWSQGRAPVDTDKVVIPADCAAYPTLSANIAYNTLTIGAGASLDLNGYSISVTNALMVAGTLAYMGGETLALSGSTVDFTGATLTGPVGKLNVLVEGEANQSVNLADFAFDQIVVSKPTGDIVWGAGFTADKFTCVAVSAMAQTFAAGNRIILRELLLDGSGDGAAKNLTLVSSEPETAWKLKVTQFASVIGVTVSDSDAIESAVVIYADQPSQDNGRNRNWNFTRSRATWLGGSGDFTDSAKWSSGEVPDVSTLIIVESNATINVVGDEDPEVQELRVIGTGNKFGGDRTLKVRGSVQMDGGGLTLDVPLHVENAMFMLNGSVLTHTANAAEDTKSVQLEVAGDLAIDKTSTISAQGKGYSLGKGYPGSKSENEAAHGGRPRSPSNATACYGSVMCPTNSGSSSNSYGTGGGRIRVVVGGTATVDGSINANGRDGDWLSAAGGSVWATFGLLAGTGVISADAGRPTSNCDGGGGRVAVYVTDSSDFDTFASAGGVISAYGSRTTVVGTLPQSSCGTVYLEGADGEKRIVIDNDGGNCNCYTDFPMPVERGGDDPKLYKEVTIVLRNKGALNVVGDVVVGDVEIETANSKPSFFLNDYEFAIEGRAHRHGKGWATWKADAGTEGKGRVIWRSGLMLFVR